MGLAISRQLNGYEAVSQLELQHLALSDLETSSDVQSGAALASGGSATWSRKVQVGRIFGAAPHRPKLSDAQHHGRMRFMCALLVLGVLVVSIFQGVFYAGLLPRAWYYSCFEYHHHGTLHHGTLRSTPASFNDDTDPVQIRFFSSGTDLVQIWYSFLTGQESRWARCRRERQPCSCVNARWVTPKDGAT